MVTDDRVLCVALPPKQQGLVTETPTLIMILFFTHFLFLSCGFAPTISTLNWPLVNTEQDVIKKK